MKNKRTYIILASAIAVAVMIYNVITEPGIKQLNGNMKEVIFTRNEQNTGPVIRIYAVTVDGEYWADMEQYGNYMPHNKYGTTRVYFFRQGTGHPTRLSAENKDIEPAYRKNCLAVYEKNGMSQVTFRKNPYLN